MKQRPFTVTILILTFVLPGISRERVEADENERDAMKFFQSYSEIFPPLSKSKGKDFSANAMHRTIDAVEQQIESCLDNAYKKGHIFFISKLKLSTLSTASVDLGNLKGLMETSKTLGSETDYSSPVCKIETARALVKMKFAAGNRLISSYLKLKEVCGSGPSIPHKKQPAPEINHLNEQGNPEEGDSSSEERPLDP